MEQKDLLRVKNQLQLAIIKTFEMEGVDPYAGVLILEAIIKEIQRPVVEMASMRKDENEAVQSSD